MHHFSCVRCEDRWIGYTRFFSTEAATAEIYTLSLHDALPIWRLWVVEWTRPKPVPILHGLGFTLVRDRKSTRLNSSHANTSYAVFCLKKKMNIGEIKEKMIQDLQTWKEAFCDGTQTEMKTRRM